MASTYTPAGIELITDGEQSGTWGQTTNTNWELIEELATGVVSVALTGATYTLTTTDGTSTEGRHAIIKFTGTPGTTVTVTVSPNDMQKIYWIVNDSDSTVTMTQGSGGNVSVLAGSKKVMYCDGAGAGAAVTDLSQDLDIAFGDNDKLTFGDSDDLEIYHDASNSIINENGTGNLKIQNAGTDVVEVSSSGIDVTGTITFDGGTTSADLNFGDNNKAIFGAGSDLQIYHDGSNSYVRDAGDGNLRLTSDSEIHIAKHNNEYMVRAIADGAVNLYYDGGTYTTPKLATTSTGIDVTGNVVSDGASLDGAVVINESGADVDFRIESDTDANAFFLDGTNGRVGIGTSSPDEKLDVRGTIQVGVDGTTAGLIRFMDSGSVTEEATISSDANGGLIFGGNSGPGELIFKTGSATERMRITSSGNVGIGTSSPSVPLHTVGSSGTVVQISAENTTSGAADTGPQIYFVGHAGTGPAGQCRIVSGKSNSTSGNTDAYMAFHTRNSGGINERMRIDSSGNVGIGTTSPAAILEVSGGSADYNPSATGTGLFHVKGGATSQYSGYIGISDAGMSLGHNGGGSRYLRFDTNETERMRIDSSGNLLVGTTSYDSSIDGFGASGSGGPMYATATAQRVQILNRRSSDGEILNFRKDGTTVGGIGNTGSTLWIRGNSGLYFGSAKVLPTDNAGTLNNGVCDLGESGYRFKDLYLSGGVYLGGTGAANYLDDYEEGTFTPAFSVEGGGTISASTTYRGDYTKIGRKVHIRIHARWDDYTSAGGNYNGAFILRNLPFQYVSAGGGGEGLLARGLFWSSNNDNNNQWSNELVLHTFYNSTGSDGAYMKWLDTKESRGTYLRQNNPLNNSSGTFLIDGEFTYITA